MVRSNTSISTVHTAVREGATSDFHFFSQHVMGNKVAPAVCVLIQLSVLERKDLEIDLTPREIHQVAEALLGWLRVRGVNVLTTFNMPAHETLAWLDLDDDSLPVQELDAAVLEVGGDSLTLRWVPSCQ